jgi:molybdate transport system permease protein
LESLIVLPLVLPPTVVGYYIIVLLGRHGVLGHPLDANFGYSIMFHWHGAVVAAATVALPLLYLPARSAFASVERDLEDVARLSGANPLHVFWHVSLPMARKGLAGGIILAFARSLGEFGATVMVLGDTARYQTLPLLVYSEHLAGEHTGAETGAVVLLSLISLAVLLVYNRSSLSRQD